MVEETHHMTPREHEPGLAVQVTRPRVMRDVNGGLWWLVSTWEHLAHLRAIKRLQRRALKRLPSDQRQGKLFSSAFQSRRPA